MSVQSVALASLTATYTDSEGEDGLEEESKNSRDSRLEKNFDEVENHSQRSNDQKGESPYFARDKASPREDDRTESSNSSHSSLADKKFKKNAPTLVTDVTSRVQRLVSYFDDTIVSDEEQGTTGMSTSVRENYKNLPQGNPEKETDTAKRANNGEAPNEPREKEFLGDSEDLWGIEIPPEPLGQCPPELQDKIFNLHRKMESGLDMNAHIQQRKEFRNPSIYEKLIQFCSINEMGTNYPPDRFDPFKWGKDSYYEELARVQKNEMDKLEKARKEKTKIEIVTGTAKRPSSNPPTVEDDAKRRKSKWDQVATSSCASVKSSLTVAQAPLTTLTSAATGTKATVISAFGSLPKKRL